MKPENVAVIMPTSYIAGCHPCIGMIEKAIASLENVGLENSPLYVVFDFHPYMAKEFLDYGDRVMELLQKRGNGFSVRSDDSVGYGGAVRMAFEVMTHKDELSPVEQWIAPLPITHVFVTTHDFVITKKIAFEDIEKAMSDHRVKHLRLNRLENENNLWDDVLRQDSANGIPVLQTGGFSDNPHFSPIEYYRDFIIPKIKTSRGTRGLETEFHPAYKEMQRKSGFSAAQRLFGCFIWGKIGDPPVLDHLGALRRKGRRPARRPTCCVKGSL